MEDNAGGGPGGGGIADSALDDVEDDEDGWDAVPVPPCVDVMTESGAGAPGMASVGDNGVEMAG